MVGDSVGRWHDSGECTLDGVIGGRGEKVYGTACRQPGGGRRATN